MWRKLIGTALVGGLVCLAAPAVQAEEQRLIPRLRGIIEENEDLKARVERLEKALATMQSQQGSAPAPAAVSPAPEVSVVAAAKPEPKKENFLRVKNPVDFYGYLKLDAFQDSARTDIGNFPRWVYSRSTHPKDAQFGMTTHQSRFGLNFKGPDKNNYKTTANVEMELYGGGAEAKPNVGMRHAFVQIEFPNDDFKLLMGQTWDVMSPLLPTTVNYNPAWWAGNIGMRHPQIRLTKGVKVSEQSKLIIAAAAVRPIGETGPFIFGDSGFDAGKPLFQGRIALQFPTYGAKGKGEIGISGHTGEEEYDYNAARQKAVAKTESLGLDLSLPLSKNFGLKGEAWKGKNLDQFAGGINQGTVLTSATGTTVLRYISPTAWTGTFQSLTSIKSQGGWFELNFGPYAKQWRYNIGASMDNPEDTIMPDASRIRNESRWVNAFYDLNDFTQFALEYTTWDTKYKNRLSGTNGRLQFACIYKF
jgi:hypothetical protein